MRGYWFLYQPKSIDPDEFFTEVVFSGQVPALQARLAVTELLGTFARHAPPGSEPYLRLVTGTGQSSLIGALENAGALVDARFLRLRRDIRESPAELEQKSTLSGVQILTWEEVEADGLLDDVRRLQYRTFLEHWGNLSKDEEAWSHHLSSRVFAPDFSVAAVVDDAVGHRRVVGYGLASVYRYPQEGTTEVSSHIDYIGVDPAFRKQGIAEALLATSWRLTLNKGWSVASLGVDVDNASRALSLYLKLGYESVEDRVAYRIAARDLSDDARRGGLDSWEFLSTTGTA